MALKDPATPSLIPLHVRLALIMIRRETEKPCDQSIARIKAIIAAVEMAEHDHVVSNDLRAAIDPDKPF